MDQSTEMSPRRIAALQKTLTEKGIDFALFATGAAFVYLLDIPTFRFQRSSVTMGPDKDRVVPSLTRPDAVLFIPADGEPLVFSIPWRADELRSFGYEPTVCYADYFANELEPFIKGGKAAIGHCCAAELRKIAEDANEYHGTSLEFTDAEGFTDAMRMIKDKKEIRLLSEVAAFTDRVMERIVPLLVPGMVPFEIEAEIQRMAFEAGAQDLSFACSCLAVEKGHPTALDPYIYPKHRPVGKEAGVAFDMGFVLGGYCSDYGRSFYIGEPSREAVESYRALQAAQLYAIEHIVPGRTKVTQVSDLIYEGLAQFGREKQLRNHEDGTQGHQIGIEVHEVPWLKRNGSDIAFQPGMVFAMEPKIFIPNEIYMRVEDMVLVTEDGARSLTTFDRELFKL